MNYTYKTTDERSNDTMLEGTPHGARNKPVKLFHLFVFLLRAKDVRQAYQVLHKEGIPVLLDVGAPMSLQQLPPQLIVVAVVVDIVQVPPTPALDIFAKRV